MLPPYRVIHCLNQFFGGMGGEEKASIPPCLFEGPIGPGNLLQKIFPDIEVVVTITFGDNYVAENTSRAVQEILDMLLCILSNNAY